ncbi:MAG: hypothetical protein KAJ19_13270 [Gammaproteobacteria bacterium]|nr:hypothetical protein [Gammaproteobacteria bacterium]
MRNYKKHHGKHVKKHRQNKVPFITKLMLWFRDLFFPKKLKNKAAVPHGWGVTGRENTKGAFGTCKYLKAKRKGLPV